MAKIIPFPKTAPKRKLCAPCRLARDDPHFTTPRHVVHPVHRKLGVFDVFGMAECPTCGAKWHRWKDGVKLVE